MSEKIKAELSAIEREHGVITPATVVETARNPDSAMHGHFEWDNSAAAEKYRLDQARALIRSVKIEVTRHEITFTVPKYLSDPSREEGGGYRSIARIRTDADAAHEVLASEMARAASAMRRARNVAAGLDLEADIVAAADRVAALDLRLRGESQPDT